MHHRAATLTLVALLMPACIPELPELDDPCAAFPETGLFRMSVETDEGKRRPYVWVPPGEGPRDVVFVLHGGGQDAQTISETTEILALADIEGFIGVFPNGTGLFANQWNLDDGFNSADKDDVAFLDATLELARAMTCGDRSLALGFSQGSMMSQRWACEGHTPPDAVSSAAGPLMIPEGDCVSEPFPIRYFAGTDDTTVPTGGGVSSRGNTFRSAEDAMAIYRTRNSCLADDPTPLLLSETTTCDVWSCEVATEFCTVVGLDHKWPGGVNKGIAGVDATTSSWDWFVSLGL